MVDGFGVLKYHQMRLYSKRGAYRIAAREADITEIIL
jgi:hypothetical protein